MQYNKVLTLLNTPRRLFSSTNVLKSSISSNQHKVNNLEKRFLVWTGKFKNVNDVPALVPMEVVEKARNRMRIRVANLMMVATLLGCIAVSMSGKRAHERGESVAKENLAWHKAYEEQSAKEETK